ncbi:MAG: hypothetical protein ACI89U_002573, partial [Gammaproteobacteria bacterium]
MNTSKTFGYDQDRVAVASSDSAKVLRNTYTLLAAT